MCMVVCMLCVRVYICVYDGQNRENVHRTIFFCICCSYFLRRKTKIWYFPQYSSSRKKWSFPSPPRRWFVNFGACVFFIYFWFLAVFAVVQLSVVHCLLHILHILQTSAGWPSHWVLKKITAGRWQTWTDNKGSSCLEFLVFETAPFVM